MHGTIRVHARLPSSVCKDVRTCYYFQPYVYVYDDIHYPSLQTPVRINFRAGNATWKRAYNGAVRAVRRLVPRMHQLRHSAGRRTDLERLGSCYSHSAKPIRGHPTAGWQGINSVPHQYGSSPVYVHARARVASAGRDTTFRPSGPGGCGYTHRHRRSTHPRTYVRAPLCEAKSCSVMCSVDACTELR